MKHLIIYAHPNPESINGTFLKRIVHRLQHQLQEVNVRDLYSLGFDPVLSLADMEGQRKGKVDEEIAVEQEYIRWADEITFVYPIWWTGMPAIMKGYIDRVMSYGFAYRYDHGVQKGLLTGKSAVIVNTQGKSEREYHESGMDIALRLTSDSGIFNYCGLDIRKHFFFDKADKATTTMISGWLNEIDDVYNQQISEGNNQ